MQIERGDPAPEALPPPANSPQPAPRSRQTGLPWFRLLLIAPGKLVTLESPFLPDEVLRRLKLAGANAETHITLVNRHEASVRLTSQNNQRRVYLWLSAGAEGGTRLLAQTQTPYRTAVIRLVIVTVLTLLGFYWMAGARFWLGVFFLFFALCFLLLSQYERVIGRDLRQYRGWLEKTLNTRVVR